MSTMVLMINLTSSSVAFAAPTSFNVVDLGAKGDGRTDSTRAFLRAWGSACASPSSSTIYVPQGRYLLNEVLFTGSAKVVLPLKLMALLLLLRIITFLGLRGFKTSIKGQKCSSVGKAANEQGVQNVTVKTATFSGSQNGVRIKTWARPSTGYVKGVLFEDIIINNARNPIIIDQDYCPHNEGCPGQVSGVKISDVVYRNIRGSSGSQVAMKFDCSPKAPCSGIVLDNVDLTYESKSASSSCINADGSAFGFVHPSSCLAA
ncbi:hypothetical protein Scep_029284 [Stephania cephalantha]|uniref:Rhamnogalacturonase A/B/Epimerase-like pectate lyase domain-containing protein n=1 Tax=Stephania cephalantha TaxID=152367 RepID=A0AAP0HC34_9MAGN